MCFIMFDESPVKLTLFCYFTKTVSITFIVEIKKNRNMKKARRLINAILTADLLCHKIVVKCRHIALMQHVSLSVILLVESLIQVMYWVVAAILNQPFKPLNIKFCIIFVHIYVH